MKRQAIDIEADILRTLKRHGPQTGVTKIVYGANLNFLIVRKYLKRLIESGLIVAEVVSKGKAPRARTVYSNTEKVPEFLGTYEALTAFISPEIEIPGVNL